MSATRIRRGQPQLKIGRLWTHAFQTPARPNLCAASSSRATEMTVIDGPPRNLEMDLAFLDGLDLPDLQQIGPPETAGMPSISSDPQQKSAQPTKGQRYRQNRKVCRFKT